MRSEIKVLIGTIIVCVAFCAFVILRTGSYNSTTHSDDVVVTEWVSPDGVHYWYQAAGYHAMLAPRYDSNGELVIDNK